MCVRSDPILDTIISMHLSNIGTLAGMSPKGPEWFGHIMGAPTMCKCVFRWAGLQYCRKEMECGLNM